MITSKKVFYLGSCALLAFVIWLLVIMTVDVRDIGPMNSFIGLAGMNGWFHQLTGVQMALYSATDIVEFLPVLVGLGFAALGLWQLIQRKSLWKVDADILCLGALFIAVGIVYAVFEVVSINYRPILIEGKLEGSFPSSTTMLVMTVSPALAVAFHHRMKNQSTAKIIGMILWAFMTVIVVLRAVSGVHWLSDIIGGALISVALVLFYVGAMKKFAVKK